MLPRPCLTNQMSPSPCLINQMLPSPCLNNQMPPSPSIINEMPSSSYLINQMPSNHFPTNHPVTLKTKIFDTWTHENKKFETKIENNVAQVITKIVSEKRPYWIQAKGCFVGTSVLAHTESVWHFRQQVCSHTFTTHLDHLLLSFV